MGCCCFWLKGSLFDEKKLIESIMKLVWMDLGQLDAVILLVVVVLSQ